MAHDRQDVGLQAVFQYLQRSLAEGAALDAVRLQEHQLFGRFGKGRRAGRWIPGRAAGIVFQDLGCQECIAHQIESRSVTHEHRNGLVLNDLHEVVQCAGNARERNSVVGEDFLHA